MSAAADASEGSRPTVMVTGSLRPLEPWDVRPELQDDPVGGPVTPGRPPTRRPGRGSEVPMSRIRARPSGTGELKNRARRLSRRSSVVTRASLP